MSMIDSSTRPRAGYVYVLSNPSIPGVVKIGRSRHGAASRAKSLSGTFVPTSFVIAFEILCLDAERAEERAHRYANKSRVSANREFFELSIRDAVGHVVQAAMVDWERHEPGEPAARRSWEPEQATPCRPEVAIAHISQLKRMLAEDGR